MASATSSRLVASTRQGTACLIMRGSNRHSISRVRGKRRVSVQETHSTTACARPAAAGHPGRWAGAPGASRATKGLDRVRTNESWACSVGRKMALGKLMPRPSLLPAAPALWPLVKEAMAAVLPEPFRPTKRTMGRPAAAHIMRWRDVAGMCEVQSYVWAMLAVGVLGRSCAPGDAPTLQFCRSTCRCLPASLVGFSVAQVQGRPLKVSSCSFPLAPRIPKQPNTIQ